MTERIRAATGYGLYLFPSDLEAKAEEHGKNLYHRAYAVGMITFSEAEGKITYLASNFVFDADDYFFIAPVLRLPSLFDRPYTGMDEVVQELKERFGAYLPDDFDFASRLVSFVGTVIE